jgi:hypothetical protein
MCLGVNERCHYLKKGVFWWAKPEVSPEVFSLFHFRISTTSAARSGCECHSLASIRIDSVIDIGRYLYRATQILFKWLNRKSQRKGYNWAQFNQVLDLLDWPVVRVRKDLNPFRREEAC